MVTKGEYYQHRGGGLLLKLYTTVLRGVMCKMKSRGAKRNFINKLEHK